MLDYIRYHAELKGTKIGCREGDCGACTILIGELKKDKLVYKSVTSCLMPIGNAANCHVVTIEGINGPGLTPVQQCFADEGATQCGFCTPGFIVSLTGFCLNEKLPTYADALDSLNGNICRCTGYKSIERAVSAFGNFQAGKSVSLKDAVQQNIVPSYFTEIKVRLKDLEKENAEAKLSESKILGGGTDLYVQQHEAMIDADIRFMNNHAFENNITVSGRRCTFSAVSTVADLAMSEIFHENFPGFDKYIKLISSTPIRNMATIAGNFCNASPIGDLTIFFLALETELGISNGTSKRTVALRNFYKGYKVIDLSPGEFVESVSFMLPAPGARFNFEKVSKRTHLDIASVNSAAYFEMDNEKIVHAALSAGGVGPVPLYLHSSSAFLPGKELTPSLIKELIPVIQEEISPISDARGSSVYKRLLLSQLVKAHFMTLFPAARLESIVKKFV